MRWRARRASSPPSTDHSRGGSNAVHTRTLSEKWQPQRNRKAAHRAPPPPPPPPPATAPAPEPSGKRKIILPIVGLIVLLGLGWGVKQWLYGRAHESTDNAQVDGHLVPVLAKVAGYVTAVNVAENDEVRQDSVLVRIDERDYQLKVEQADADLAAARASAGGNGVTGQAQAAVANATGQEAALNANVSPPAPTTPRRSRTCAGCGSWSTSRSCRASSSTPRRRRSTRRVRSSPQRRTMRVLLAQEWPMRRPASGSPPRA